MVLSRLRFCCAPMTRHWLSLLLCVLSLVLGFTAPTYAATDNAIAPDSATTVSPLSDFEGAQATAIFAGGCFWCMEKPFDELPGVTQTTSGYTGGTVENPSYKQVSSGKTGHVEAVEVTYDPAQVSYNKLLQVFWRNIDPVDERGQFCDKGSQYRSVIFYQTEAQREAAQAAKQALATEKFEQGIATEIQPASKFYPAEDYHQNYYKTHPIRYKVYRFACGRDQRLAKIWREDPA